MGSANRQHSLVGANEESSFWPRRCVFYALVQVAVNSVESVRWKGTPSGSPLERLDEKNAGTCVHIPHAEAQGLSEADAGVGPLSSPQRLRSLIMWFGERREANAMADYSDCAGRRWSE
jgi:hypothetical protein